jgi:hypothetical protein
LVENQAEIVRLLEAINGGGPAEFFTISVRNDATEWIASKLRFGANIGLRPEVSTAILFDTLNEIRTIVVARIEGERTEASRRNDG